MGEPIRKQNLTAPTPQNTPASASSMQQPPRASAGSGGMASISEQAGLGALAANPALLSLIQGRLGELVGKSSGYIESLPKTVKDRLAALKALRADQAKIEADFQREVLELEKKFNAKYQPLYEQRSKIVQGSVEPTPEQVEAGEKAFAEEDEFFGGSEKSDDESQNGEGDEGKDEDEDTEKEVEEELGYRGVPNFWLTAMKTVPPLADIINERDDEVLQHLVDVRLKYLDTPGYMLEFEFDEGNSAFTNKVLTKTYHYRDEIGLTGDFVYDSAEGCDIRWTSPEANVTVRIEKRKQRNKHTKATRTIEKTLPVQSFFTFFTPPKPIGGGESGAESATEDEYDEEQQEQLEMDFGIGDMFKEKLVPRAIDWFTGRAIDYEELNDPNAGEFGGEDDYEDEDGSEEDEEDDDAGAQAGKKEVPAECKQQ